MSQERGVRRPPAGGGMGMGPGGRPGMGMGMPVEKAKDFKGTIKRLAGYLMPHKFLLAIVFIAAIISTIFNIVSPRFLVRQLPSCSKV
ncbi:hypothetical protein KDW_36290 [Dictyobacter vulcani]|uniref:Uncharacterized protein n=1 Tax=Dictyobacter vulcani TaxID=2607529 RepID=A0A5J4KSS4_9CHLR|nr:hypothetical protein [Dictyobacter vulcani]GER89467.1 hypothetical protein KDW_36290 [Dictyobacter vulcani]